MREDTRPQTRPLNVIDTLQPISLHFQDAVLKKETESTRWQAMRLRNTTLKDCAIAGKPKIKGMTPTLPTTLPTKASGTLSMRGDNALPRLNNKKLNASARQHLTANRHSLPHRRDQVRRKR